MQSSNNSGSVSGSRRPVGGSASASPLLHRLITRQDCVDAAQALLCRLGGAIRVSEASNTTNTTSEEDDDEDWDSSSLSIGSAYQRRHSFDNHSNFSLSSASAASLQAQAVGRRGTTGRQRQPPPTKLSHSEAVDHVTVSPLPALPDSVLAHILSFTDPATKLTILEDVPELRDLVFLHSVWRCDLIDLSFLTYDSAVYRRSVLRHGIKLLMRMGRYLRHLRLTITNDHFYTAARLNHALLRAVIAYCPNVQSIQLLLKWSEDVGIGEELDADTDCLLKLLDCLLSRCRGLVSVNCSHSSLSVTCAIVRCLHNRLPERCLSLQCVPFFKPHSPSESARLPRLTPQLASRLTSLRHLTVSYLWNNAHEAALMWLATRGCLKSLTVDTGFMSRYQHQSNWQQQQGSETGYNWRDRFWRELILAAPRLELSFILYGEPSTLWLSDLASLPAPPPVRALYVQTQNAEQELPLLLRCVAAGAGLEYLAVHAVGPLEERGWSAELTRQLLSLAPRLRGFAYEGGRLRERELLAIARHYGSQLRCLHVRLEELLESEQLPVSQQQRQQQQQPIELPTTRPMQRRNYEADYGLVRDVLYGYLHVEWSALAPSAHLPPMRRLVLDDFFNPLRPAACQLYQLASRDHLLD